MDERIFHGVSWLVGIMVVWLIISNQALIGNHNITVRGVDVIMWRNVVDKRPKPLSSDRNNWLNSSNETLATQSECTRRLPSAVVVGIQKCGTTALEKFLGQHPGIVSAAGEPQYFSGNYDRGPEWYRNTMPCSFPGQLTIEKSPPYFYRDYVPDRIKHLNPDMKMIVIVKDPIVRSQSMHAMLYRDKQTSFEEVITNARGEINNRSQLVDFSTYPTHMKPWLDSFSLDQFCFIDGHNFEHHPEEELRKLENFLNVSSFFGPETFWFNKKKQKPCFHVSGHAPQCLGDHKGRKHPMLSKQLRKKLEIYFHPLNEKFFRMIKRRFNWGY